MGARDRGNRSRRPDRAGGRFAGRGAQRDGRRRQRAAGDCAPAAPPRLRAFAAPAPLAGRCRSAALFGRRARRPARPAAQPCVVRRAGQVGPVGRARRTLLGQSPARPAARRPAPDRGDHHAAGGAARAAARRRSGGRTDRRPNRRQCAQPVARLRRRGAAAIRWQPARKTGTRWRTDRRCRGRAVEPCVARAVPRTGCVEPGAAGGGRGRSARFGARRCLRDRRRRAGRRRCRAGAGR